VSNGPAHCHRNIVGDLLSSPVQYTPRDTFCLQKLALTLKTSGGLPVGIVRSRTQATEFSFSFKSFPVDYLSVLPLSSITLQPIGGPRPLFQFLNPIGRVIRPSQGRYLHTGQHKHNKRTQISMPGMGFEPTTPMFERANAIDVIPHSHLSVRSPKY
jgi:hypothetical protein